MLQIWLPITNCMDVFCHVIYNRLLYFVNTCSYCSKLMLWALQLNLSFQICVLRIVRNVKGCNEWDMKMNGRQWSNMNVSCLHISITVIPNAKRNKMDILTSVIFFGRGSFKALTKTELLYDTFLREMLVPSLLIYRVRQGNLTFSSWH
jgi:hypothetical protein